MFLCKEHALFRIQLRKFFILATCNIHSDHAEQKTWVSLRPVQKTKDGSSKNIVPSKSRRTYHDLMECHSQTITFIMKGLGFSGKLAMTAH
jgi:hypothetical protein